jgi:magnesium chelatase family protein
MLAKTLSSAVVGIDAILIDVEVDIAQGLPQLSTVGLPDGAVKESKDRVKSALKNAGYEFPQRRITVNLAPADIKKEGASFDLPISIGILAATGVVRGPKVADYLLIGELSLDGTVKKVRGCLSVAVAAKRSGLKGVIVPKENACEGAVVEGIEVIGVSELAEVVTFLNGEREIEPHAVDILEIFQAGCEYADDFSEVKGQEHAKRALEVAAGRRAQHFNYIINLTLHTYPFSIKKTYLTTHRRNWFDKVPLIEPITSSVIPIHQPTIHSDQ